MPPDSTIAFFDDSNELDNHSIHSFLVAVGSESVEEWLHIFWSPLWASEEKVAKTGRRVG